MARFLKSFKEYLSIPLGILIVGILTFLFGPGQCTNRTQFETKNGIDKTFETKDQRSHETEESIKSISSNMDKPNTSDFESLDTKVIDLNLVDSILNYRYRSIDDFIDQFGLDSALTQIDDQRYNSYTEQQKEEITNYIKGLLIRKEYNVDGAHRNVAAGLIIIEKSDKYGFLNKEGIIVHQPIFENIDPIHFYPYTAVLEDNQWGLIDSLGNLQVPISYDSIDIIIDSERFCKLYKGQAINVFDLYEGEFKYKNLHTFNRIWAEHIIVNIKNKYALFDLEFDRLIEGDHDMIELIDGGDDYYIKVTDRSIKKYYNLGLKEVSNPLVN